MIPVRTKYECRREVHAFLVEKLDRISFWKLAVIDFVKKEIFSIRRTRTILLHSPMKLLWALVARCQKWSTKNVLCFICFVGFLRAENSSTIPDVSKAVPKNSSHQLKLPLLSKASQHQPSTSLSFFNTLLPSSNKPATNSASALASRTIDCNDSEQQDHQQQLQQQQSHAQLDSSSDSTAILMPSNSTNLFGRNGIKSNFNQFARMTFGDSANANNTGDKSNNDYCNTSTGDAKAYKLLNSLS